MYCVQHRGTKRVVLMKMAPFSSLDFWLSGGPTSNPVFSFWNIRVKMERIVNRRQKHALPLHLIGIFLVSKTRTFHWALLLSSYSARQHKKVFKYCLVNNGFASQPISQSHGTSDFTHVANWNCCVRVRVTRAYMHVYLCACVCLCVGGGGNSIGSLLWKFGKEKRIRKPNIYRRLFSRHHLSANSINVMVILVGVICTFFT